MMGLEPGSPTRAAALHTAAGFALVTVLAVWKDWLGTGFARRERSQSMWKRSAPRETGTILRLWLPARVTP